MNRIPGFQAESSLGPPRGSYRATARFGGSGGTTQVSPAALGLGLDLFPPIRCCGFVPMLGRFVCVTRPFHPLEQCSCQRDFFGFPIILCRPPENAPPA